MSSGIEVLPGMRERHKRLARPVEAKLSNIVASVVKDVLPPAESQYSARRIRLRGGRK